MEERGTKRDGEKELEAEREGHERRTPEQRDFRYALSYYWGHHLSPG